MICLEDRLRPCAEPSGHVRDVTTSVLLLALVVALLPAWWMDTGSGPDQHGLFDAIERISRQMLEFCLLPAMAFLLALRCGAVDLSVWVAASLGGLTAATAMNWGVSAWAALPAGVAAGAALGAINGVLTVRARVPSIVATVAVALAAMWGLQACANGGRVIACEEAIGNWSETLRTSPATAASVLVFVGYTITMLVVLGAEIGERSGHSLDRRRKLFAALTASGALSAAGGVSWLIAHQSTPVPGRLVDDLRIPAAAILAGGAYLAGPGRTLLAGVLLPLSVAVATAWRQEVWDLRIQAPPGYSTQAALLIVMLIGARYAITRRPPPARGGRWRMGLAGMAFVGIVMVALAARAPSHAAVRLLHAIGLAVWMIGVAEAMLLGLLLRRRGTPEAQPDTREG